MAALNDSPADITDVVFGWYGVMVERLPRLVLEGQYPSGVIDMVLDTDDIWGFDYYDAMLECGWSEERVLADYEQHHGPAVAWVLRVYLERRRLALHAVMPGMGAMLCDLRSRRIRMWALANAAAVDYDMALEQFPELGALSGSIVSARERLRMPDPVLMHRAEERFGRLGLDVSRTLYVDTDTRSVEVARQAGWRGVVFQDAGQLRRELALDWRPFYRASEGPSLQSCL
ncbi:MULTISPECIES: hypothetical protein [Bifidobacterium]|uniref:hypothetical protein n=1 Tax=Bifidobacterium TaxID=1678 RepID=UPI00126A4978|nr:hypothetical protein [Bifidobacterium tibiigranuli]MCH3973927.1 hypothetical protein [Bifidobacterium tibiigranuli]MCH4190340.1 hypothetical protein [Bifidobacterium tibiigranuli]MCH4203921.1 hypothetical protein [Bifidobacterium tibiigranuli]MCH4274237.1 hypothetical protein [Bifidobacterium tibiigranuli]MCI1211803.1 hypothetical protein [Bifidobacterium tibiigranuli]